MNLDKLLQLIRVHQIILPRLGVSEFVVTLQQESTAAVLLPKNLFPARLIITAKRLRTIYITLDKMLPQRQIDSII